MVSFLKIASLTSLLFILMHMLEYVSAGPIVAGSGVAMCYSACNAGYVTCMMGCGLVAGVQVRWLDLQQQHVQ